MSLTRTRRTRGGDHSMANDGRLRPKRRYSRLPYLVAMVSLGALVAAAWIGRDRFQPVIVGSRAPDFEATGMDGDVVHMEDFAGSVVLVNVWATWCPPCLEEMPSLERLYREVRTWPTGSDFEILAVSIDARIDLPDFLGRGVERSDLVKFASDLDLTFTILHDPSGRIERRYQTLAVPESFLVGRDGVIYKRVPGATEWDSEQYRDLIQRLLAD